MARRHLPLQLVRSTAAPRLAPGVLWMKTLVCASVAVMGCGGPQPAPLTEGLRTRSEENDLRAKKRKEKDEQEARKKADEEAVRLAEAQKRERDEAEKERRKQEMAARERVEREKRDADAKTEAPANENTPSAASEAAIKAFTSVAEIQIIPLPQTFPDKVLCPFDTEHLRDAACDLAVIGSETVRMSVERSAAVDGQPPTWTVIGSQFDAISQSWGPPVTVCRLVVRNRMLRLEWPNPEISPQHALFRTMENGAVIVSCKTAAGNAEIRRQILFAEPIDLAASGTDTITLDPLAGKAEAQFDPRIAARLKVIEPAALRWSLKLTHLQWTRPEQIRTPDTQLTIQLPSKPLPGVVIGYQQVDAKGQEMVQLVGQLWIEAALTFSRQEASLKVGSKITGLSFVPLLDPVITLDTLRDAFRRPGGLDPLEKAALKVLTDRFLNEKYRVLAFDAFAQGSDDCTKLGITNMAGFKSQRQNLDLEKAAIRKPGQSYPNPSGIGSFTYTDEAEYKSLRDASARNFAELKRIEDAFVNGERDRARQEATAIRQALEDNAKWFEPIIVKIQSLAAIATDSKGREYSLPIVKSPVE
jgi:hypothetical protein